MYIHPPVHYLGYRGKRFSRQYFDKPAARILARRAMYRHGRRVLGRMRLVNTETGMRLVNTETMRQFRRVK